MDGYGCVCLSMAEYGSVYMAGYGCVWLYGCMAEYD